MEWTVGYVVRKPLRDKIAATELGCTNSQWLVLKMVDALNYLSSFSFSAINSAILRLITSLVWPAPACWSPVPTVEWFSSYWDAHASLVKVSWSSICHSHGGSGCHIVDICNISHRPHGGCQPIEGKIYSQIGSNQVRIYGCIMELTKHVLSWPLVLVAK